MLQCRLILFLGSANKVIKQRWNQHALFDTRDWTTIDTSRAKRVLSQIIWDLLPADRPSTSGEKSLSENATTINRSILTPIEGLPQANVHPVRLLAKILNTEGMASYINLALCVYVCVCVCVCVCLCARARMCVRGFGHISFPKSTTLYPIWWDNVRLFHNCIVLINILSFPVISYKHGTIWITLHNQSHTYIKIRTHMQGVKKIAIICYVQSILEKIDSI